MKIVKSLFRLFQKKEEFKILVLENSISGDFVNQIINKEISGIIVKKAITNIEIKSINLDSFPNKIDTPFGCIYGKSIIGNDEPILNYLNENNHYNQKLNSLLENFDLKKTIENYLNKLSGNREIKLFKDGLNNLDYKISTLRIIEPNKSNGMQIHIGNEFMTNYDQTRNIRKEIINKTQLSFFFLLQQPDEGGDLVIYEKYWHETPKEIVVSGALMNKKEERDKFLQNCKSINIKLEKGDLLIFDGGRIWHEVKPVLGNKNRITVGGFLGMSKDKTKVYYWS